MFFRVTARMMLIFITLFGAGHMVGVNNQWNLGSFALVSFGILYATLIVYASCVHEDLIREEADENGSQGKDSEVP